MLGSLADFNYIPYGVYRIAMKLRYIQKKTRLCHVTTDMWKTVVEEHCLENPNLVLQPAEISSVVTSLLQAVAQEVGDEVMINEDECARLMLSWFSILYPQSALTALQLNIPVILLCNSETIAKHHLLFEMTRMSGYELTHKQLSHMLHLSSYLILSCGENTSLGSSGSQTVAQSCFYFNNMPLHRGVTLQQYERWILSEPEYLAWVPTLYRLNISQHMKHEAKCGACKCYPILGLRYRCLKCVNLDLCQECFLKGEVYKNHDETHPLKEYIRQGTKSESIKDLTALVKTYFRPKSSKPSTRVPSEGRPKSTVSQYESAGDYETITTEDWFARKGRLPLQTPLQYTSCPALQVTDEKHMLLLQQQNNNLAAQVDRLRKEVAMNSPPPYHTQSEVMSLAQSSYYEAIPEPDNRSHSPGKLPTYPTRPLSPLQTIAEIADSFTTDLGLYSGDDRERHPVISGAGNIGFAMDSFLTEMFHKTPPPKPKRTSPNRSKASSCTPPSSRNSTPSHSGIDIQLAFDPHNKTQPAYLVHPTQQPRGENNGPLYQKIYSSTPKLPKRQVMDISFTCSSVRSDQSGSLDGVQQNGDSRSLENGGGVRNCGRGEENDIRGIDNGGRGVHKKQLKRLSPGNNLSSSDLDTSVQGRRRNCDTNGQTDRHSLADSSITRSIRKVYQPPPLLLRAVDSVVDVSGRGAARDAESCGRGAARDAESCGRGAERDSESCQSSRLRNFNGRSAQRNRISRNYRGSMDLSIYADNSDTGGSCALYNSSSRILSSKYVV
ncbi:dystrophin-like isoform X2 [Bolinopsis microptera]|uniref:dystrophin-like isoform X2 n=1 Tax=Bolinopsis microptera TaxID=2820187 RepID=UPI00307AD931